MLWFLCLSKIIFNNTTDRKITGDDSGSNLQPNLYVQQGRIKYTKTKRKLHQELTGDDNYFAFESSLIIRALHGSTAAAHDYLFFVLTKISPIHYECCPDGIEKLSA